MGRVEVNERRASMSMSMSMSMSLSLFEVERSQLVCHTSVRYMHV
jgi:hypothetical protein